MRADDLSKPLLLPIAVACAVGIATAMHAPGVSLRAWGLLVLVGAVTTVVAALGRRVRVAVAAVMVAAFAFGALRLAQVAYALPPGHLGRMTEMADADGVLLRIEAVAVDRPILMPRRGALARYDHRPPRWRFRAEVVATLASDAGGEPIRIPTGGTVRFSVPYDGSRAASIAPVAAGERFVAIGRLRPPTRPRNPGESDSHRQARLSGIVGTFVADVDAVRSIDRARGVSPALWRLRSAFRAHGDAVLRHALPRSLDDESRGLIRAMLLGERQDGLDDLEPAFRRTGLAHLLAISGFHLAVLAGAATILARGARMNVRRAALAVTAGVIPYLLMVEAQPSVMRAGAMLLAVATATMLGRGWSSGGTFALALLAIIVPWPGDLARPGLQLSFAVVAGLVWLTPSIRARWFAPVDRHASTAKEFLVERARVAAAIAITAWLVSTPLILFHFGMASPLAAPLSVVAIPLTAALLVCGHLTLAVTPLIGDLCHLLGWLVARLAEALIAFVRHADTLPGVAVFRPSPGVVWLTLAMTAVAALGVAPKTSPIPRETPRRLLPSRLEAVRRRAVRWHDRFANPIRRFGLPALAALILAWPLRPPPPLAPEIALRVDMLAVGDGTCIVLRTADRTMLYDAGSTDLSIGGRTLVPALRALGVRSLDVIVISHADADHYAGLPEIVDALPVGRVIVTDELLERVRARGGPVRTAFSAVARREIPVELAATGSTRTFGPATLRWLHPSPGHRTSRSNDHSQVIAVEVAGRTLLLCGDIEDEAVDAIRRSHPTLRSDAVELPHHGSWRRPAVDFIVALEPEVILQSTGPRRLNPDRWSPLLTERLPSTTRLVTAHAGAVWLEIHTDGTMHSGTMRDKRNPSSHRRCAQRRQAAKAPRKRRTKAPLS